MDFYSQVRFNSLSWTRKARCKRKSLVWGTGDLLRHLESKERESQRDKTFNKVSWIRWLFLSWKHLLTLGIDRKLRIWAFHWLGGVELGWGKVRAELLEVILESLNHALFFPSGHFPSARNCTGFIMGWNCIPTKDVVVLIPSSYKCEFIWKGGFLQMIKFRWGH